MTAATAAGTASSSRHCGSRTARTSGTLLRTCDAVGAGMAVPDTPHYRDALAVGDTLRLHRRPCIHWVDTGKLRWVRLQRQAGWRIVAVELAAAPALAPRGGGRSFYSLQVVERKLPVGQQNVPFEHANLPPWQKRLRAT